MTSVNHSIVWINAKEARIVGVERGLNHRATIQALDTTAVPLVNNADTSSEYFHRVARALDWADEILIVGPCSTKVDFLKYMHKNDHAIDPRILGIESIAAPNDKELLEFAGLYFTLGGPIRSGNGSKLNSH